MSISLCCLFGGIRYSAVTVKNYATPVITCNMHFSVMKTKCVVVEEHSKYYAR